jgi:2-C-methyl-D-erythritol 4-phosphate cytidylyltransferase/2-C-methyl-D-erythritol 2,4-cyclodiphosphate synthase
MHVTAIIAAGGAGRRLGAAVPKQLLEIGGRSILERSVAAFSSHPRIQDVIVALPHQLASSPPVWLAQLPRVRIVAGGARRQDSVAAAFDAVTSTSEIVLVHDAARPFVSAEVIERCIEAAAASGGAIAAVPASDTVKRVMAGGAIAETIPRDAVYLAQTPQAFRRSVLADAVAIGRSGVEATDEAALAERAGHTVRVVSGDPANVKITTSADLEDARSRTADSAGRVGIGYDLHRLVDGRPLILGGVKIESFRGALGHSDADAASHAVTDAILGGACLGDIGVHFPDKDPEWKGASSVDLLSRAAALVRDAGLDISHVDVVIVLERPRIAPHAEAIRRGLAAALGISIENVSVKGKTNEGIDAIGRGEAIAAHAVALLRRTSFIVQSS